MLRSEYMAAPVPEPAQPITFDEALDNFPAEASPEAPAKEDEERAAFEKWFISDAVTDEESEDSAAMWQGWYARARLVLSGSQE